MSHAVVVQFELKPGILEEFRQLVQRQARLSLEREPGCEVFDVCLDPGNSYRVVLYEIYASAEDFAQHLASEHFRNFDSDTASMIANKTVWQLERMAP